MSRVLLVNTLYAPYQVGGAERSVRFLAQALREEGFDTTVACTDPGAGIREDDVDGVRVYRVGLRNVYWPFGEVERSAASKVVHHALDDGNPLMAAAFAKVLDTVRPALVHTNNIAGFSSAIWKATKRRGVPVVHTLRDYHLLCVRATMFRNGRICGTPCADCRLLTLRRRRATRHVDTVVGISRAVLAEHLDRGLFAGAHNTIIYNPSRISPRMPRGNVGGEGRVTFGYLGRVSPEKGIEFLLHVLRSVGTEGWHLRVGGTGDPEYMNRLGALAHGLPVEFAGHVDPEAFFPTIDVLIAPSLWHEPMGRIIIEAFGYGIPVVGSRRGGIPELIAEGVTGWTFDPSVPDDLRMRLEALSQAREQLTRMKDACREAALAFAPPVVARRYADLFRLQLADLQADLHGHPTGRG